jgi:hypothetical protein
MNNTACRAGARGAGCTASGFTACVIRSA